MPYSIALFDYVEEDLTARIRQAVTSFPCTDSTHPFHERGTEAPRHEEFAEPLSSSSYLFRWPVAVAKGSYQSEGLGVPSAPPLETR